MKNDAYKNQDDRDGIYTKYKTVNGKTSWVSGENAIWYNPNLNSWGIGALDDLGSEIVGIGKANC